MCSLVHIHFSRHDVEIKCVLIDYSCSEPVGEYQEGEDNYFSRHPDVVTNWKKESTHMHWKRFGKTEGRGYFCACPESKDVIGSEPE